MSGFCCDMRRYFLTGVVGVRVDEPAPTSVADFIADWKGPDGRIVLQSKYCTWCGAEIGSGQRDVAARVLLGVAIDGEGLYHLAHDGVGLCGAEPLEETGLGVEDWGKIRACGVCSDRSGM